MGLIKNKNYFSQATIVFSFKNFPFGSDTLGGNNAK